MVLGIKQQSNGQSYWSRELQQIVYIFERILVPYSATEAQYFLGRFTCCLWVRCLTSTPKLYVLCLVIGGE